MLTIISCICTNIFQMEHVSAVKFYELWAKLELFFLYQNIRKFEQQMEQVSWGGMCCADGDMLTTSNNKVISKW